MAVMNATERLRARIGVIRNYALNRFVKTEIAAAVAAADDWIDTNQTSFNNALPVNFRTNATLAEKTLLFCVVAMRRANQLRVSEDG
jgi:hypothetical protein